MHKYWAIFRISLLEAFAYRVNFLMWRVRQVLVFLIPFFVWTSLLQSGGSIYGYNLSSLLTYLFGTTLLRSLVLGSRTVDLAGIINNGDLSLYLLIPVNIKKYWFTRDLSDKLYNLSFMFIEFPLIIFLFRPPIFIQTNPLIVLQAMVLITLAVVLYFYINFLFGLIGFWARDVWAPRFMLMVIMEFTTGSLFPLDMLPSFGQFLLNITPFPYLLFFPLQTYLGKNPNFLLTLVITSAWILAIRYVTNRIWNIGVKNYEAEGR